MKLSASIPFSLLLLATSCAEKPNPHTSETNPQTDDIAAAVASLENAAFADEKEARQFENLGIVPLWNQLINAQQSDRLNILGTINFEQLQLGKIHSEQSYDLGIHTKTIIAGGNTLNPSAWLKLVESYRDQGFQLVHSDWHQESFQRDTAKVASSEIRFKLQGTRDDGRDRLEIKGTLHITWNETGENPTPSSIIVRNATISSRNGTTAFESRAVIEGNTSAKRSNETRSDMGAICVYDLDGDQLPEILLGNANRILWNQGDFKFEARPLIPENGRVFRSVVGLVADLNGDSIPDWLCDTNIGALALYQGNLSGGFSGNPRRIDLGEHSLKIPSCITAGDIDNDGDLDLFVAQWRSLYDRMPEKFWDANDGFGNTLLLNDGLGNFTDATETNGLGEKRKRRTYSSSFIDLDQDNDLDLIVISDFYGIDTYLNNGNGQFTDATDTLIDQPHAFGMSHTVADYNRDGRPDIYMLGMGSTTARRLEKMNANPAEHPETNAMRTIMGYGNRMYLASQNGNYAAPKFMDQIARTGWSWGSTSADFDNDGDQDIYIANGHISGKSTQDYCTNFWCRDIYVLKDRPTAAINTYLNLLPNMQEQSWDGFQINPLLVNQDGEGFQDFGFLLDVGFDFDARHVISADLDLDGRVDLLVDRMQGTTGFFNSGKEAAQPPALFVLQNTIDTGTRPWIGVTLPIARHSSPQGARIELLDETGKVSQSAVILSGDSFASQHPAMKHFGLGKSEKIASIRVIWPGGKTTTLKDPTPRKYHAINPQD